MNRYLVGFLAIVVMGLASCASVAERRDSGEALALVQLHAGKPVKSVSLMTVDDFEVLNDYTILLWERRSRAYLIEVDRPCHDLSFTMAIALDRQAPWLNARTDAVRVRDQRCFIQEIRVVDVPALKAARKQAKASRVN